MRCNFYFADNFQSEWNCRVYAISFPTLIEILLCLSSPLAGLMIPKRTELPKECSLNTITVTTAAFIFFRCMLHRSEQAPYNHISPNDCNSSYLSDYYKYPTHNYNHKWLGLQLNRAVCPLQLRSHCHLNAGRYVSWRNSTSLNKL